MKIVVFASLCSGLTYAASLDTADQFNSKNYAGEDIITRDVAIIGGGATGTYSAINLRNLGKSVVVVEREAELGGHTNTYIDPSTGVPVNYGVQAIWNISASRDYFELLDIPAIQLTGGAPQTTVYADFQTGSQVDIHPSNNYTAYAVQVDKNPQLLYSWKLPSPVPEDLLLPFRDYVVKYDLQDIVYSIFAGGEGVANFLDQLTVNIFKMIDGSFLNSITGGAMVPASGNNGEIYDKALAILGSDALLSSTVASAQRPSTGKSGVSLVVNTPTGKKLIKASKLLLSIPPLVDNLKPFDLDATETGLFSKWSCSYYYVLLVKNTGLPTGYKYANAVASNDTFNVPSLPAPYQVTETPIQGLFRVWYGSPYALTQAQIETDATTVIKRLRSMTSSAVTTDPEYVEFKSHSPFKLDVSANAIKGGFYDKLENLQGHRDTWYTGAAFMSHDVSVLWNFTQSIVLPKLLAEK